MSVLGTEGRRVRRGAGLRERSGQRPGAAVRGETEGDGIPRIEAGESGAMG